MVRALVLGVVALVLSVAAGQAMVDFLRQRGLGKEISSDGPASHAAKAGTPTMGGILILTAVVVPTLLWANLESIFVWVALGSTLGYGAIGFADDYLKLVRKRSEGLSGLT